MLHAPDMTCLKYPREVQQPRDARNLAVEGNGKMSARTKCSDDVQQIGRMWAENTGVVLPQDDCRYADAHAAEQGHTLRLPSHLAVHSKHSLQPEHDWVH